MSSFVNSSGRGGCRRTTSAREKPAARRSARSASASRPVPWWNSARRSVASSCGVRARFCFAARRIASHQPNRWWNAALLSLSV
jgi:hypothetical protein